LFLKNHYGTSSISKEDIDRRTASMKILGSTESISSLSGQHIPATIVQEGEKVYLIREEEDGRRQKGLLERDIRFYRRSRKFLPKEQVPFNHIILYVTSRCNLHCPVCFEDESPSGDDLSLDQISGFLKDYKGKTIVLGGREPTCRKDLPDIIRLASQKNQVMLTTNGLKIADLEYVRQLKRAGLSRVAFSFNGFRDEIYEKINGAPLLDTKLQALKNLKREGIRTNLSITLVRGINDDQLKDMVQYCMENRSFISQLRIRTMAPLGRHLKAQPYHLSEMVDLLARSLNVSLDDFMKEEALREKMKDVFPIRSFPRLCSIQFHLRGRHIPRPVAMDFDPLKIEQSSFKKIAVVSEAIRHYGLRYLKDYISKVPLIFKKLFPSPLLSVEFRCWPNANNLDLIENRKCLTGIFREGRVQPLCYANVTREIDLQVKKRSKEKG
jgi:uncharacterized Fe-S cluster-containing radical SAM superfamily protein